MRHMDQIIRHVADLGADERRAFEHVLGQPLRNDQQVVLGVQPATPPDAKRNESSPPEDVVPDWWKIYDGLSDAEIDELDATIRQRANLTRLFNE